MSGLQSLYFLWRLVRVGSEGRRASSLWILDWRSVPVAGPVGRGSRARLKALRSGRECRA